MKGIGGFSTPTESYANRFPFLPYCWLTNNVGNMNELIKITEKNGKQVVSAKELYLGLGLDKSNWSRWSKVNIEEDKFFNKSEDWVRLKDDSDNQLVTNPNKVSYDYVITLDFAKHLAMMARTEKSYEYRNYFLECERIAKSTVEKSLPKTFAEALRLAAEQAEKIEAQQKLLELKDTIISEYEPKVNYYDLILSSKDAINITVIAKDYGMSAKAMNKKLNELGVIFKSGDTWLPYQKYAVMGYTKTGTVSYNDGKSSAVHSKWTQKGRLFLYDLLKNNDILPLIER